MGTDPHPTDTDPLYAGLVLVGVAGAALTLLILGLLYGWAVPLVLFVGGFALLGALT